jgi:hypothetical protein
MTNDPCAHGTPVEVGVVDDDQPCAVTLVELRIGPLWGHAPITLYNILADLSTAASAGRRYLGAMTRRRLEEAIGDAVETIRSRDWRTSPTAKTAKLLRECAERHLQFAGDVLIELTFDGSGDVRTLGPGAVATVLAGRGPSQTPVTAAVASARPPDLAPWPATAELRSAPTRYGRVRDVLQTLGAARSLRRPLEIKLEHVGARVGLESAGAVSHMTLTTLQGNSVWFESPEDSLLTVLAEITREANRLALAAGDRALVPCFSELGRAAGAPTHDRLAACRRIHRRLLARHWTRRLADGAAW